MLVGQSNFLSVTLVAASYPVKALHFFFTTLWQITRKAFYFIAT